MQVLQIFSLRRLVVAGIALATALGLEAPSVAADGSGIEYFPASNGTPTSRKGRY